MRRPLEYSFFPIKEWPPFRYAVTPIGHEGHHDGCDEDQADQRPGAADVVCEPSAKALSRFLGFLSLRGPDPERIPSPGSAIPTRRREY